MFFSSQFDNLLDVCALWAVPGAQKWTLVDFCNSTVLAGKALKNLAGHCTQGVGWGVKILIRFDFFPFVQILRRSGKGKLKTSRFIGRVRPSCEEGSKAVVEFRWGKTQNFEKKNIRSLFLGLSNQGNSHQKTFLGNNLPSSILNNQSLKSLLVQKLNSLYFLRGFLVLKDTRKPFCQCGEKKMWRHGDNLLHTLSRVLSPQ